MKIRTFHAQYCVSIFFIVLTPNTQKWAWRSPQFRITNRFSRQNLKQWKLLILRQTIVHPINALLFFNFLIGIHQPELWGLRHTAKNTVVQKNDSKLAVAKTLALYAKSFAYLTSQNFFKAGSICHWCSPMFVVIYRPKAIANAIGLYISYAHPLAANSLAQKDNIYIYTI